MTEILIDADFGHPPERVWRALTDHALLSEWFMRTDLEPYPGRRFRLMPDGLLGLAGPLEGELLEVTEPRRLVMLWRGEQMHSRVTWELVPLPGGCRFQLSHTGFIGAKGSLRRKELRRAYDEMMTERLPRVLGRLAADAPVLNPAQPPQRSAAAPSPVVPSPSAPSPVAPSGPAEPAADNRIRAAGERSAPGSCRAPDLDEEPVGPRRTGIARWLHALPHRRRGQLLALAAAALLAVLTTAVISSLGIPTFIPPFDAGPDDQPITSLGTPGPSPGGVPPPLPASAGPVGERVGVSPGQPGRSAPPSGTAAPVPVRSPAPSAEGPPARRWQAAYRTVSGSAREFSGELTVTNSSTGPASGWAVIVTLPDGARLTSVRRAAGSQSGNSVTFTSKNSGKVGPGASVTVEFAVAGAAAPTGCRIEGQDCTGLSG